MGSQHFDLPLTAARGVAPDNWGALSYSVDAEQGPVRLRYFTPPERVRPYFGSLYIFSVAADRYADVTRADVPQLRLMLQGGGRYHFQDGTSGSPTAASLLGPTMGATRFELNAPTRLVGVSLLPAGWMALHGGDAHRMADRLCDIAVERDPSFADLLAQLQGMDDGDAMAALVWSFLADRIKPLSAANWALLKAIDSWLIGEGSPRIEVLSDMTELSPRQLARITNKFYGAPPKYLARKYRALRCSARIALDGESWQALCDDGSFYDQSHFIREIKHFIGMTPHQLQAEPTAVVQLTLLRRTLGGDVAVLNRLS